MTPRKLAKAQKHLAQRDRVLNKLIALHGRCTLRHDSNHYRVLVRSIVAQQISSKAAISISARLAESLGPAGIEPEAVAKISNEQLRQAGLSANKTRSIRDLTDHVLTGKIPLDLLPQMTDEEVIEKLTPVHGIGRWTAEMFLIFSLGRMDVLPAGDYGLKAGVQKQYRLRKLPEKGRLEELTDPWKPFRSIGTWYIWRSFGNVPQS